MPRCGCYSFLRRRTRDAGGAAARGHVALLLPCGCLCCRNRQSRPGKDGSASALLAPLFLPVPNRPSRASSRLPSEGAPLLGTRKCRHNPCTDLRCTCPALHLLRALTDAAGARHSAGRGSAKGWLTFAAAGFPEEVSAAIYILMLRAQTTFIPLLLFLKEINYSSLDKMQVRRILCGKASPRRNCGLSFSPLQAHSVVAAVDASISTMLFTGSPKE